MSEKAFGAHYVQPYFQIHNNESDREARQIRAGEQRGSEKSPLLRADEKVDYISGRCELTFPPGEAVSADSLRFRRTCGQASFPTVQSVAADKKKACFSGRLPRNFRPVLLLSRCRVPPGASTSASKDARIPAESSRRERPFAQKGFTTEILYVLLIPGVNDATRRPLREQPGRG